jgi:hypothetical protein
MRHFRLVGMTIKPREPHVGHGSGAAPLAPQVRFIFQMIDPENPEHMVEQLYVHLKWDVVDPGADEAERARQVRAFLTRVDALTAARESGEGEAAERVFFDEIATAHPVDAVSFSSSLTGLWVFGNLERDRASGDLHARRVVRSGIDYGFYSTVYDTDLLREEIGKTEGERKAELQSVLDALTVTTFRDPKRQDVDALRFDTVSCAQCHQTAGRDGVHMSVNDGINSKITSPTIVSQFFFREADAQLRGDMQSWLAAE